MHRPAPGQEIDRARPTPTCGDHLAVIQWLADRSPFGLFTLAEALAQGVDRFRVAELCRADCLVREAPGLYRDAAVPPVVNLPAAVAQRYLDAVAHHAKGDHQVRGALSGLAGLHQLGCACSPDDPHFPIDPSLVESRPLVVVDRAHDLRMRRPPFDITRVDWSRVRLRIRDRIWCVDAAHAVADVIARADDPRSALTVVDAARNRLLLTVPDLVARWRELGTRGSRLLLAMESEGLLEQESEGERRAFHALFDGRSPVPDCQVIVVGARRGDFVFISSGIVVEYLGRAAHEARWQQDVRRLVELQQAGWLVIFVTAEMLQDAEGLSRYIYAEHERRLDLVRRGVIPRPVLPSQHPGRTPLRTLI
jgi:hypothetical protein